MAALVLALALGGCSSLRKDPYASWYNPEEPTSGGVWSERGLLDDETPESAYRMDGDRAPASAGGGMADAGGDSWVSPDRADANRRDYFRGGPPAEDGAEPAVAARKPLFKRGNRATRADFVDESQSEGSLWASDGQTNYYFTKNKIRSVGDIVTINLEDGLLKDVGLEIRRTLDKEERERELELAQLKLAAGDRAPATAAKPAAAKPEPGKEPAATKEEAKSDDVRDATLADIDVLPRLSIKTGDQMLAEIVERFPNGNYKIRGSKKVPYQAGAPRVVNFVAIVRSQDISEEDLVASGKLYEYRLEAIR